MQAVKLREEVDHIINVSECDINTVYQIHFTCDQRSLAKLSWQNGTRTEPTQLAALDMRRSARTVMTSMRASGPVARRALVWPGPCAKSHGARNVVNKI